MTRIVLTLAFLVSAMPIAVLILSSCARGSCGPEQDLSSQVVLESAELMSSGSTCQIVGVLFNHSDRTAHGGINFRVYQIDGTQTVDAFADFFGVVSGGTCCGIPPHSSGTFRTSSILRRGGGFPSCSQIARFELAGIRATDSNCTGGAGTL